MKYVVCILILTLAFACTGYIISAFQHKQQTLSRCLLNGYIVVFAAFQLCATPFMLWRLPLFPLTVILGVLLTAPIVSAAFLLVRKPVTITAPARNFFSRLRAKELVWLVVVGLIAYQVYMAVVYQHTDADDGFFITTATTALQTNRVFAYEPSMGMDLFLHPEQYRLVSYEILLAALSAIFGLQPAILAHTALPLLLIPLAYCCVFELGKLLTKHISWWLLLYCVINQFAFYSLNSQGSFLLLRIWQGKAQLATIILPFLFILFVEFYQNQMSGRAVSFWTSACILAGLCASTVGLYLVPMLLMCLFFAYCVNIKSIRAIKYFIIPAGFSVINAALLMSIVYANPIRADAIAGAGRDFNFIEIFRNFNGSGVLLLLFVLSCMWHLIMGNSKNKLLFVWLPIFLLFTILNPLLAEYVARYITGVAVYWRVFWLLPIYPSVVTACLDCMERFPSQRKAVYAGCLLYVIIFGRTLYNDTLFTKTETIYKLEGPTAYLANCILEDDATPVVMAPEQIAPYFRQYSARITMQWSRSGYVLGNYRNAGQEDKFTALQTLYSILYQDGLSDVQEFNDLIILFKLTHIVCPSGASSVPMIKTLGYTKLISYENYDIYCVSCSA